MSVNLRKMTSKEYDVFYEYSINNHASELMKEMDISFEDALSQTEAEVQEMLPDGMNTKDNSLMVIEDIPGSRNVGSIWYLYEVTDGVQQIFLCDFVIDESERKKGYATEALSVMERNAIEYGCKVSVLFVAKENEPAQKLYAKCGYIFHREQDDGMYLKKKL
ncbi:MAG TPA: hypothetical protein DDY59_04940 [Lachnospiraceae bacterium]|jgi:RimJ/RimL family protein N-acetyltransferase|nr:hypothetical protein [Lachnospiraceae bacterium]HBI72521.1 hypothetical protein [Lachnospiraceae bacterium]HCM14303.1 hypothetical protein [Lachnospiraceae bacterium]